MGRITPSFRQLYEETVAELKSEFQAAMVDLGHKSAFDLILRRMHGLASKRYGQLDAADRVR